MLWKVFYDLCCTHDSSFSSITFYSFHTIITFNAHGWKRRFIVSKMWWNVYYNVWCRHFLLEGFGKKVRKVSPKRQMGRKGDGRCNLWKSDQNASYVMNNIYRCTTWKKIRSKKSKITVIIKNAMLGNLLLLP